MVSAMCSVFWSANWKFRFLRAFRSRQIFCGKLALAIAIVCLVYRPYIILIKWDGFRSEAVVLNVPTSKADFFQEKNSEVDDRHRLNKKKSNTVWQTLHEIADCLTGTIENGVHTSSRRTSVRASRGLDHGRCPLSSRFAIAKRGLVEYCIYGEQRA